MTEHKFTDDEIIRAFKCCSNADRITECGVCPYYRKGCLDKVHADAADLIKRQKANLQEVITLNSKLEAKNAELQRLLDFYEETSGNKKARAEAIKEFVEGLKEKLYGFPTVYNSAFSRMIDNLVKEMTVANDTNDGNKVSPGDICVVCGNQVPEGRQVCYMCETGQEFLNKKKE